MLRSKGLLRLKVLLRLAAEALEYLRVYRTLGKTDLNAPLPLRADMCVRHSKGRGRDVAGVCR